MDLFIQAGKIGEILKISGKTISVAETSAGGLISASLLSVPGASSYFIGGGVLYTYESRHKMLSVDENFFEGLRPSTEEYAIRLVQGVQKHLGSDYAIAESGASGPSGNRYGDSPGHCCIAVSSTEISKSITIETGNENREENMKVFAKSALSLFHEIL
ncbi:MAG: CinA family protein [Nitrospinota bacterium]|nr:CinA family protein [Nitrospinota bacterium]